MNSQENQENPQNRERSGIFVTRIARPLTKLVGHAVHDEIEALQAQVVMHSMTYEAWPEWRFNSDLRFRVQPHDVHRCDDAVESEVVVQDQYPMDAFLNHLLGDLRGRCVSVNGNQFC